MTSTSSGSTSTVPNMATSSSSNSAGNAKRKEMGARNIRSRKRSIKNFVKHTKKATKSLAMARIRKKKTPKIFDVIKFLGPSIDLSTR